MFLPEKDATIAVLPLPTSPATNHHSPHQAVVLMPLRASQQCTSVYATTNPASLNIRITLDVDEKTTYQSYPCYHRGTGTKEAEMEKNAGWHILIENPDGDIIESLDIETFDLNRDSHGVILGRDIQEAIDNAK